ncbi:protein CDV3 homolog isoform X2 [Coccinella septempunctata]|uniref:protein CDV3 homolog isoform X2 n=1 Tax=Coccinella septempunctata TaxID=41139 RepID=UPI001D0654B1|nr:protein CDV3 homolog isoform X2 [Coccinella septempunctata]
MADLDDFFAKKDRKKGKSSKKFSTTEEVAKKLEDNAKKTEIKKKPDRPVDGEEPNTPEEQDEWKEFEEEKKDYTGLKIGNLSINQNNDGSQGNGDSNSEQQQGDEGDQQSEKKAGPWKKIEEIVEAAPPPPPPKVEEKPKSTNRTYVIPTLRHQVQSRNAKPVIKGAPDVHNEEMFPTLSKTNDYRRNRNEGSFEVVQHNKSSSYRHSEQSRVNSSEGAKLTLGNRWNSLSHDS